MTVIFVLSICKELVSHFYSLQYTLSLLFRYATKIAGKVGRSGLDHFHAHTPSSAFDTLHGSLN